MAFGFIIYCSLWMNAESGSKTKNRLSRNGDYFPWKIELLKPQRKSMHKHNKFYIKKAFATIPNTTTKCMLSRARNINRGIENIWPKRYDFQIILYAISFGSELVSKRVLNQSLLETIKIYYFTSA